jgi:UDP-N-acetyl-D-mannosaminuronic acid dehydrogenase
MIRQEKITVIGLGYVGLPMACILASAGYQVTGVDIDHDVVARVQSGSINNPEPNLQELLSNVIDTGNLTASISVSPADIYIVAVPTPIDPSRQPDISCVNAAIDTITPHLKPDDLILIESTCPIGTTEAVARKVRLMCPQAYVAYCPERILPGNILWELVHNDRVIGGVDDASTSIASRFYRTFVLGEVLSSDARTAEAVKLIENTYRDVNIAYANELSMIADHLALDVNELIRLANRHPRVQILQPSPGVGGHCIAIDPWFLISSAPHLAKLATHAREVNLTKTDWVIEKVRKAIKESGANVIACLGLTYKADVSDIRESPAMAIVKKLEHEIDLLRYDPYHTEDENLYDILARAHIVVGLVPHREFLTIPSHYLAGKIVLDFAGVFK